MFKYFPNYSKLFQKSFRILEFDKLVIVSVIRNNSNICKLQFYIMPDAIYIFISFYSIQ